MVEFGLYAIISSFTDLLTVADYGLGLGVIRSMAVDQSGSASQRAAAQADVFAAHSTYTALAALVIVAAAALAALAPTMATVPQHDELAVQIAVLLAGGAAAIGLATASLPAIATGRRNFRLVSVASLAGLAVRTSIVVGLGPSLRLVALALAVTLGMMAERLVLAAWVTRNVSWFRLRPGRTSFAAIRRVGYFALPAMVFSVTAQVITAVDTVIIGALAGVTAVTIYRLGITLPLQAVAVLYQAFSAAFPSFARAGDPSAQEHAMRFLSRILSFIAGLGFALLACFRGDLVSLLLGHNSDLAERVFVVFSCALALDAAVHCPASVVIARGRHARMAAFSPLELAVNVGLTLALVRAVGPVGAAVGTLGANLAIDLFAFPFVLKREFSTSPLRVIAVDGLLPAASGAVVAAVAAVLLGGIQGTGTRFLLTVLLALATGSGLTALALGSRGRRLFRSSFSRAPSAR